MTHRTLSTALLALVFVSATGIAVWADHGGDPHDAIGNHAASLANHSRELYDEVRVHHRGEPATANLLSDVLNLYRSARRMTSYADAHSSASTLEREVSRMEGAYHSLEETLRRVSFHHGSHRHIREHMRCIDDLVHEIHDDIHHLGRRRVSPVSGRYDLGPSDWYFGGGGFSARLGR